MKPPDQPFSLMDVTEDEEATENEVIIVEVVTTVETKAEVAMMIRNTPALTAN